MNPAGIRGHYNIPNFTAIRKDWVARGGQGIAPYFRRDLRVEELQLPDLPFEPIAVRLFLKDQPPIVVVQIYCISRLNPSRLNHSSHSWSNIQRF